jgi:hypothetical protein
MQPTPSRKKCRFPGSTVVSPLAATSRRRSPQACQMTTKSRQAFAQGDDICFCCRLHHLTELVWPGAIQRVEPDNFLAVSVKNGSFYDERVVFTQNQVFAMQSYRLLQRGPAFSEDTEISLERASGKYRVNRKAHKNGRCRCSSLFQARPR